MAGDHYALSGLAVPEELARLHELLGRAATEHPEVPEADLMMLETAVLELAGNVVEHGRPPGKVVWSFTLDVGAELRATLADSGEAHQGRRSTEMPDPLAESGRGLALAVLVLDELHYSREADANVWTMVRRLENAT